MGKPSAGNAAESCTESIGAGSEPGEVKHLSTRRKIKQSAIPSVVASESGTSLNRSDASLTGVVGRNGDDPEKKRR